MGSSVHIISGLRQHGFENLDTRIKDQPGELSSVSIGEDTWIGNGAIVAADVGKKCVIGVGSVVVKPIPDFVIAAGNPARVIKYRKRSPRKNNSSFRLICFPKFQETTRYRCRENQNPTISTGKQKYFPLYSQDFEIAIFYPCSSVFIRV